MFCKMIFSNKLGFILETVFSNIKTINSTPLVIYFIVFTNSSSKAG